MNSNFVHSVLNPVLPGVDIVHACQERILQSQTSDANITQVKNNIICSDFSKNGKDLYLRSSESDNERIGEFRNKNEISVLIKDSTDIFAWADDIIKKAKNNSEEQSKCSGEYSVKPNYLLDVACFCKALGDDGFSQEFAKQTAYFRAKMTEENVFDGIIEEVYNDQCKYDFLESLDDNLNKFKSFLGKNGGNYSIIELFFFEQNGSSLSPFSTAIKTWIISQRNKHWEYFFFCEGNDYEERKCKKYENISLFDAQITAGFSSEEKRKQMLNDFKCITDEDWNKAINDINNHESCLRYGDNTGYKKICLNPISISVRKGCITPNEISSLPLQNTEVNKSFDNTFLMLYAYNQELLYRLQFPEDLKTKTKQMHVARVIDYKNFYNVFGLDSNEKDKIGSKLQAKNTAIYESSSLGNYGEGISGFASHTIQFLIPLHRIFVSFFVSKELRDERECLSITEGLEGTIYEKKNLDDLYGCKNQDNPSNLCKWTRKNLAANIAITNTSSDVRELFLSVQKLIQEDGNSIDVIPFCQFLGISLDVAEFQSNLSGDEKEILKNQIKIVIVNEKNQIDESLLAVLISTLVQLNVVDKDISAAVQSIVENFVTKQGNSEGNNNINLFLLLTIKKFFDTFYPNTDIVNTLKEECFKSIINVLVKDEAQNNQLFDDLFNEICMAKIYPALELIKFIISNKKEFKEKITNDAVSNILKLNKELIGYFGMINDLDLQVISYITSSVSDIIGGYNKAQQDIVGEIFYEILNKLLFQKKLAEEDTKHIEKIINIICSEENRKNFLPDDQKKGIFMIYELALSRLLQSVKNEDNVIGFLNNLMKSFDIIPDTDEKLSC